MRVPHDRLYHAEIRYETLECFNFSCAIGHTIQELLDDIRSEMAQLEHREPELVTALYDPNGECIDITRKVKDLL